MVLAKPKTIGKESIHTCCSFFLNPEDLQQFLIGASFCYVWCHKCRFKSSLPATPTNVAAPL